MMLFLENVKLALSAIKSNKMRSFLTMLGIIIGISSVIAITSIGDGAKAVIDKEFAAFGKNYFIIYVNWQMIDDYVRTEDLFTREDLEAIKARFSAELGYVSSYEQTSSDTKVGRITGKLTVMGVNGNVEKFKNMRMLHGRTPSNEDVLATRDYVVIPKEAAVNLFGKENAVGMTLPITNYGETTDFTVIGVYETEQSLFNSMMGMGNYEVYVPYTYWYGGNDINTLYLDMYLNPGYDVTTVSTQIANYASKIKGKPDGFYIADTVAGQQNMMNDMLGTLSIAIGAIAAISLLVGGIGIMNIMLVSVTERTREIGIRKSLGAKTGDILVQFLIEAMIVSAIGGLIGTGLGIGMAAVGLSFAGVGVRIDPMIILLAVGFSAAVGMFFGLYPARKAAKLDPIDALRYE